MNTTIKTYNRIAGVTLLAIIPLLYFSLGNFPERTALKESISIITLLAYFMAIGQFYLSRGNKNILKPHKASKVVKLHKILGYVLGGVIIFHPFFVILPRYFEAGIAPADAFTTMITSWDSTGIILGMIAWVSMLILALTSIFRKKLGMKYTTWRIFHGILSIVFIIVATWHAINLGRHTDTPLSIYMIVIAAVGVFMILKVYFIKNSKPGKND